MKSRIKFRIMAMIAAMCLFLLFGATISALVNGNGGYLNGEPPDIEMVFVGGGLFTMGCTPEQGSDCESIEMPAHQVTLSDFYIGKYEVTQAQWKAVMGSDNNPSEFKGDDLPVEMVSRYDVQGFIARLNAMTEKNYRLPTEAEWEYAARGGNRSRGYKYSGSDNVDEVAWYVENSGFKTHPVGTKLPNELGIYDMSGNVGEMVFDSFLRYSDAARINPAASAVALHVIRGLGWNADAGQNYSVRVPFRAANVPDFRSNRLGFRLVISSEVLLDDPLAVITAAALASNNRPDAGQTRTAVPAPSANADLPCGEYFEISAPAQLDGIRNNLSGCYKLMADISLASYYNWAPIGTPQEPFTGKIDGNGYKITGLKINRSEEQCVGLFGSVQGGVIRRLALENVSVVGRNTVGGIAGRMTDGTLVANSYTTGSVSSFGVFSGGIVGQASSSTITNSFSKAIINFDSFIVDNNVDPGPGPSGGIAGSLVDSAVSNSYSSGTVLAVNPAGGIVGLTSGSDIINSYSTGDVNAVGGPSGGIAGRMTSGRIVNSYSTGTINAPVISGLPTESKVGGIVGEIVGTNAVQTPTTIRNCAALNPALNASSAAGRIFAGIQGVHNFEALNNFALETMYAGGSAGFSNTADTRLNGVAKTDAQLKRQSAYSDDAEGGAAGGLGWKFGTDDESPWKMPAGGGYPVLYWQ